MLRIEMIRRVTFCLALGTLFIVFAATPGCKPKTAGDPTPPAPDAAETADSAADAGTDLASDAAEESGLIHQITGEADYQSFIKSAPVTVVDFFAVWCGPCRQLAPKMGEMAAEFAEKGVKFAMADTDKTEGLARGLGISAIPNIQIFAGGEMVAEITGNEPDKIRRRIEEALGSAPTADKTEPASSDTADGELSVPVDGAPVAEEAAGSAAPNSGEKTYPGADGRIKKISPSDSFDAVITSAKIVVIDFNAVWCGPCQKLGPYLERMAETYRSDGVSFFSADTDENSELAQELGVEGIPDIRVYVNGNPAGKVIGCEPFEIMETVDQAIHSNQSGVSAEK